MKKARKPFVKKEFRPWTQAEEQNQKHDRLINAGLFALGWMVGKAGLEADPVKVLAEALKENGADCEHVDAILEQLRERVSE